MRSMRWLVPALLLAAAVASPARAYTTYVLESLTITSSTVSTFSETEMDYSTSQYYCAEADGFLRVNGSIVQSGYAIGGYASGNPSCAGGTSTTASLSLSAATELSATCEMQTNHWVIAAFEYVVGGQVQYYLDQYGYSNVSPQNFTGQGTVYATGSVIDDTQSGKYYIASTYLSQTTYPPNITGVDSGYPADGTLGSSGYTVLYGNYLAPDTQVNIDGTGVSATPTYTGDTQVNFEYAISQSANTGPHNLTVTTAFGTSNAVTFTVGDPTPAISSVSPSTWNAGMTTSFTVYGTGFGTNPSLAISGSGITSYAITGGSNTQVTGLVTVDASAPAENVTITITSNGYNGQPFVPAQSGQSPQGSISGQVYPLTVSQSPTSLNLSTGDTNTTVTVSVSPSNIAFTPAFSWGLQSNPNSDCDANLGFTNNGGTGSVSETVTAAPAGCSGIFNAVAYVGSKGSGTSSQVMVPPQIMIQTAVGEAGGQTGAGDASIPSLLLVAKNRFGDNGFPGGATATWQAVLVPSQFYGANDTTPDGVEPELDYAAQVYSGTTAVTVPAGCEAYWSPTDTQFAALQQYTNSAPSAITDTMWSAVGAPGVWTNQSKQAVIKTSIANNVRSGYTSAPAFVLFRLAPSGASSAVITVP